MGAEDREFEPGVTAPAAEHSPAPSGTPASAADLYDQPPLTDVLWEEPYRFEFFAALRILARMAEDRQAASDDPRPAHSHLLFRAHQSLSFPASEIWSLSKPTCGNRLAEMTVAFLGMTGPLGALPRP